MGMNLENGVQIKVYDSSADTRYMVLPICPKDTEGLTEDQLAEIITRDSLIGVGDPEFHPQN